MTTINNNVQLNDAEMGRLKAYLQSEFVPFLPELMPNTKSNAEIEKKQLSRAFSAFALSHLCKLTPEEAAKTVVDDFNDGGVDAIYLEDSSQSLYFVQGKLKAGVEFQQAEAQKFLAGVKRLVAGDTTGMNERITGRTPSIEDDLDDCDKIILVVAYTGANVSVTARTDISRVTGDRDQDEKRFVHPFIEFGPLQIRLAMNEAAAYQKHC